MSAADGVLLEHSSSTNTVDNNTACYNAVVGIEAYTSSVNNTIRSNNCSSNDYGIRIYASGNTIGWNLCDSNTNHGIYLQGGTNNLIENNTIRDNANYGVYLTSSSSGNEFHNNTLTGNTGGTIYNNDSTDVNAQYNYWGTISETDIQNSTYDRRDDASKGWILYSPWWDSNFTTLHYADIDPPYTTDDYDGLWHRYDVLVTLTAIDNGTGVYATYYRIDGGAWQTGNNVTIHAWANHTNDGNHTIEYYSEDWAGNNETVRSVTVHIDTTPPELRVFYENATDRVRKYAVDDLDPVPLKRMKKRGTLRTFILTDHAGNVAIIKADWYDGVKNGWRVRKMVFRKAGYNGGPWQYFDHARWGMRTLKTGTTVTKMRQVTGAGSWYIEGTYRQTRGTTRIHVSDNGWTTHVYSGLTASEVWASNGSLRYVLP